MQLVLMRHAEAWNRDSTLYPDDAARPLTRAGREVHRQVARALSRLDLGIQMVVSSPFVRARDTAEITAGELGYAGGVELLAELGEQFSVPALGDALRRYPPDMNILAVGHQPDLGRFAAAMLHASGEIAIAVPQSAALALDFEGHPAAGQGVLRFLLPPAAAL